jgi:hypothetical protein
VNIRSIIELSNIKSPQLRLIQAYYYCTVTHINLSDILRIKLGSIVWYWDKVDQDHLNSRFYVNLHFLKQ